MAHITLRRRTICLLSTALILLAGCANTGSDYYTGDTLGGENASQAKIDKAKPTHDPLLDAPNRATMKCTTEVPITVLQRVKEVPFACSDIGVSATIDEIRDAGWRVLSLDIGEDTEIENHIGFPVTITVRKLL